ncbi:MAG: hypothetical protein M1838_002563 [Thelocarpon superellum]|nr:MAG: hypothetical protein M1838_002563 [Thelocarpon superellum]
MAGEKHDNQAGRRVSLYGTIHAKPSILLVERSAFANTVEELTGLVSSLHDIQNIGHNDIYAWYLACSGTSSVPPSTSASISTSHVSTTSTSTSTSRPSSTSTTTAMTRSAATPDLKLNLIHPCTEVHVKKYSHQGVRMVTETPEIYAQLVRPYMQRKREEGRLNWVFNIIEGRTEQEDVILRDEGGEGSGAGPEGFLMLPDLNWDRKTLTSLHLLGLVHRRDIWSLRDLRRSHVTWLKHMRRKLLDATVRLYPPLEHDELKLYVHYQPTYYHFHIHIVHVALEAGATQATGKAFGLENLISQLEMMAPPLSSASVMGPGPGTGEGAGEEAEREEVEPGLAHLTLTYTLGEASELWTEIFGPLSNESARKEMEGV